MITDSTNKHLTDQEFFTHIKLFKLLFNHETIENDYEDNDTFKLSDGPDPKIRTPILYKN